MCLPIWDCWSFFVLSVFFSPLKIEIYIFLVERKSKSIFDEQWRRTNAKKRLNAKQANWILLRVAWMMNPIIYTPLPPPSPSLSSPLSARERENRKKTNTQTLKQNNRKGNRQIPPNMKRRRKKNQPNRPNQQIKLESEREKRTRQT